MRVGELVKHYVGDILRYCENDPNELLRLMDAAYSKRKFNIRWPFLTEAGGITSRDHPVLARPLCFRRQTTENLQPVV